MQIPPSVCGHGQAVRRLRHYLKSRESANLGAGMAYQRVPGCLNHAQAEASESWWGFAKRQQFKADRAMVTRAL
eukprot:2262233-Pyramimonas_sp.AAC.1